MLRFVADVNFNNDIIRGVRRRNAAVDFVRLQDVGLSEAEDPEVLHWAAQAGRVLLTHDVSAMTAFAYERIKAGKPMPGLFEVPRGLSMREVIDELLILAECSFEGEWEGQVRYLPLL